MTSSISRTSSLFAFTLIMVLSFFTTTAHAASLSAPSSYDFGEAVVNWGESQWREINVYHDGSTPDPVYIDSVEVEGPDASAFTIEWSGCAGQDVWPGGWCNINMRFQPESGRQYSATLKISAGRGEIEVQLTGHGLMFEITPSESPVDFGEVPVGAKATRSVSLKNSGNVPFQPFVVVVGGGNVGSFRLHSDSCVLSLVMPGETCTVTVEFHPGEASKVSSNVLVFAQGDPVMVPMRGKGIEPVQSAAPSPAPATGPTSTKTSEAAGGPVLVLNKRYSARALRSGNQARIVVRLRNWGDATAGQARICVDDPQRRLAINSRCVRIGSLQPGEAKRVSFRVRVKGGPTVNQHGAHMGLNFRAAARGADRVVTRAWLRMGSPDRRG